MSDKTADTLENGQIAQGEALAVKFNEHCRDEGSKLMRYMQDLFVLSLQGRKAFRVNIEHILKQWRAEVKKHEGQEDHELFQRMARSAGVRMSEAVTVSKAFDAGFNPLFELSSANTIVVKVNDQFAGYHALIGYARSFLDSQAANGPTAKRGRKAKDAVTKACEYLAKLELDEVGKDAIIAFLSGQSEA